MLYLADVADVLYRVLVIVPASCSLSPDSSTGWQSVHLLMSIEQRLFLHQPSQVKPELRGK